MTLNRMDSGFFVWLALSFCFGYNEAKRETNVLFILKKFGESMISYIKGTLERRGENDIIVEAGGIGYRIFVSPATLAKLPQTGMPDSALGIALFIMEMGGILGAKLILQCKKLRYRWVFVITSVLVLCGVLIEHTGVAVLMTLGGFVAACSDDALQVRTDAILQEMFPSEQRATLISMESFTFSMIMIVLSPLAGIVFSVW